MASPVALSPLVTLLKQAMWTHVAGSGHLPVPLPTPLRAHIPTGWGHGGTRKSSTSRRVQTWSVRPAAIAGVHGRHCLADPVKPRQRRLCWLSQQITANRVYSGPVYPVHVTGSGVMSLPGGAP
jgi:hypothetical protein